MSELDKSTVQPQSFLRQVPYSLEAEQAVLGAIIIDSERFDDITGVITSEDFYVERHRQIFSAVQSMYLESRTIDTVTLLSNITANSPMDEAELKNYIIQICQMVPSVSNIKDYAKIVHDKAILRKLISVTEEISEDAYSEVDEAIKIVDSAEAKIFSLSQGNITKDFQLIGDVILEYYQQLTNLMNNPEGANGTPTYYRDLDRVLVGMGAGDLILIGARPGMGKTSFALNIASQVAMHSGKSVAVFSLEMPATQLVGRLLSSEARIDSYKLRKGDISPEEFQALAQAATAFSKTQIYIDDSSDITVAGMKSKLRRLKNLGLIVIDYLQLMRSDRNIDNRVLEVGDISRNLKLMAKEFGIPIICCAQLSRASESRTTKKPMLSDLRDSGAIEQDADVVIFLYREEYYKVTGAEEKKSDKDGGGEPDKAKDNIAEIIVAKNRHGETGSVEMGWEGQFTRFTTLDKNYENA